MPDRKLTTTIRAIISVLRDVDYEGRDEVIASLERLKETIFYTAPEAMGDRWQQLVSILDEDLPSDATKAWTVTIAGLCAGRLDAEFYEEMMVIENDDIHDEPLTSS